MCHESLLKVVASIVILCWHSGHAQIATYDVHLGNLLHMQQGIGWPLYLHVQEGHEALMKLTENLENQETCMVTTPLGARFDVHHPPSERYEPWSDGCGVRVRNVVSTDVGRWRLTAFRANHTIMGWSELEIAESISSYTPEAISLHDGETNTLVDLSSLNNSYCLVSQPFTESSLVSGHCRVTLDRTTRAVQGRWSVILGLPGRVSELHVDRTVSVESERLDVGYVRDTENHKLHLYCNILHTTKNITFCRFQKSTEAFGFNVMDGLSDGRYSYYGNGFFNRECGLTIESVTADDYGTWRCTVGVQERDGTVIHQVTPMQALLSVHAEGGTRIRRHIQRSESEIRTLFVQEDTKLTITCRADASLSYCWFQHPNGSQFTPVERLQGDEQAFWYTGQNLASGDCGITFAYAHADDTGIWTCHMSYRYERGVEKTDQIAVRVTGPLAANRLEVGAAIGSIATLYCHTSNGLNPLDYCRFLSPNFVGISLDSTVTAQNALLDRFYFTPERSLDYGDCSLTISPVLAEDFGVWTCAALLHDQLVEARDTVHLYYDSTRMPRLRAGLIGTAVGVVILAIIIGGVMWYKRGKPVPVVWSRPISRNLRYSQNSETNSMDMEMATRTEQPRASNSTTNSNSSNNELEPQRAAL